MHTFLAREREREKEGKMDGRKSKKSAGNVQALVLLLPLLFLQVWQSPDPSRTLDCFALLPKRTLLHVVEQPKRRYI